MGAIYITKWALSPIGILKVTGQQPDESGTMMLTRDGMKYSDYVSKRHIHATLEVAVARAEAMRAAKIWSHRKSIDALQALKFEVKA